MNLLPWLLSPSLDGTYVVDKGTPVQAEHVAKSITLSKFDISLENMSISSPVALLLLLALEHHEQLHQLPSYPVHALSPSVDNFYLLKCLCTKAPCPSLPIVNSPSQPGTAGRGATDICLLRAHLQSLLKLNFVNIVN